MELVWGCNEPQLSTPKGQTYQDTRICLVTKSVLSPTSSKAYVRRVSAMRVFRNPFDKSLPNVLMHVLVALRCHERQSPHFDTIRQD